MESLDYESINISKLRSVKRQPINLLQEKSKEIAYLQPEVQAFPIIIPPVKGLNIVNWSQNNRHLIETNLLRHGSIFFQNFHVTSVAEFEQFIKTVSPELMEYIYRSTPRTTINGQIYTSTEYPANQVIPLHNEMSYSPTWPMKIWFFCIQPAQQGGETLIADSRKVFASINPKIREQFIQKKVMYVQNYRNELGLSWQNVFQTTNRLDVEKYCYQVGIEFEWKDSNHLRTRQVCQAIATHPQTGERVWFNQAHLFHVSSLEPKVLQWLLTEFKQEDLPRNAYYGDGSAIEISVLDEIREIYQQHTVSLLWQAGDVLMLDNMLVAHGRARFTGSRKVAVGMAEPYFLAE